MDALHSALSSQAFGVFVGVWVVGYLLASVLIRRAQGKSPFAPTSNPYLFSEKWASGRALDTWWSKLGGARNCLFVGVSRDKIVIQPHFPFTLGFLPEIYRLETRIPMNRIARLARKRLWFQNTIVLEYFDELRARRFYQLQLRHPEDFLNAVQSCTGIAP